MNPLRTKGDTLSSSSMEIIVSNEDLMALLLLYLPVKSILRFKSVSKQWYSILSHPKFIQRHASRSRQTYSNSVLFLRLGFRSLYLKGNNYGGGLDTVDLPSLLQESFDQDRLYVITCCNGLLLIEGTNFSVRVGEFRIRRFYACNPFTKKHLELDVPDYIARAPDIIFNLAFDPLKSPHYKVIFFWSDVRSRTNYYHIAIYSSETRSCKKLGYTFESRLSWLCSGEFLNDAIHWIHPCRPTSTYFDINQERIKEYPMPQHSEPQKGCLYFGKCQGRLILILGDVKGLRQRVLDVYELEEDCSSWVVKYKIDLEVIAVGFPEIMVTKNKSLMTKSGYEYSCLCVMEDEKQEPTLVVLVGNQLVGYNLINKRTKKLCRVQYTCFLNIEYENFRGYWWFKAFQCFENLFGV